MRTADGYSPSVNSGDVIFSLLGFVGLYLLLALLFVYLIHREIAHGPKIAAH
jgi:cytochrome d ubiquinol oxidase subunit I